MRELAAITALLAADMHRRPLYLDDMFADPFEQLETIKRVVGYKPKRRNMPIGPTKKRSSVKAARKANVRRMQRA